MKNQNLTSQNQFFCKVSRIQLYKHRQLTVGLADKNALVMSVQIKDDYQLDNSLSIIKLKEIEEIVDSIGYKWIHSSENN